MRKGVSAVVAIVLLLMMTVAAAGLAYVFMTNIQESAQTSASAGVNSISDALTSCISVESAYNNRLSIRNCGSGKITNNSFTVYIDGAPVASSISPATLNKGDSGEMALSGIWGLSYGKHDMKLTNGILNIEKTIIAGPRTDGLAARWSFDDFGSTIRDESGNGVTLSVKNLVTSVSGKFGAAIQMDPSVSTTCTNQNAGLINSSALPAAIQNLPSGKFTLSWWNNMPTNVGATRVHLASASVAGCGTCSIWNRLSNVEIRTVAGDNNDISYAAPSVNQWHLFTFVFDKPSLTTKMYIDGVQAASGALTAGGDYGTVKWVGVGVYNPTCSDSIPGEIIDEVRIYNTNLTPDELIGLEIK